MDYHIYGGLRFTSIYDLFFIYNVYMFVLGNFFVALEVDTASAKPSATPKLDSKCNSHNCMLSLSTLCCRFFRFLCRDSFVGDNVCFLKCFCWFCRKGTRPRMCTCGCLVNISDSCFIFWFQKLFCTGLQILLQYV